MYFYVIYVATEPVFEISSPKLTYGQKTVNFLYFPGKISRSNFRRLFGGQIIKNVKKGLCSDIDNTFILQSPLLVLKNVLRLLQNLNSRKCTKSNMAAVAMVTVKVCVNKFVFLNLLFIGTLYSCIKSTKICIIKKIV